MRRRSLASLEMPRDRSVFLTLRFADVDRPALGDVSSFLYDLELLHDLYAIVLSDHYYQFGFSRFFWYRKGRKIRPEDKIREVRISNESPLQLVVEIVVGGIAVASGVAYLVLRNLQTIASIRRTNQEIRHQEDLHPLEMEEQRLRIEQLRRLGRIDERRVEQMMSQRGATEIREQVERRLVENPLGVADIEITLPPAGDEVERDTD
jgi:hypothetical protein